MKELLFIVLVFCCIASCCKNNYAANIKKETEKSNLVIQHDSSNLISSNSDTMRIVFPSKEILTLLGKQVVDIILNCDSITFHVISFDDQLEGEKYSIDGYTISKSAVLTNDLYIKKIKGCLLNTSSYFFQDFKKSCLFIPEIAIDFHHKSEGSVLVLNDFSCDKGIYKHKEHSQMNHTDLFRKQLLHIIIHVFPDNDNFINLNLNIK